MAEQIGWRSFWWLNVGMFGFTIIATIFLFPETKWHRQHMTDVNQGSTLPSPVSEGVLKEGSSDDHIEESKTQAQFPRLAASETAQKDPYLGKGVPSKQQFKLWQPRDPHSNLLREILTPWKLMVLPIVQFASFVVSWSASVFLTVNLTQSQNFAAPPYNYSSSVIGALQWHPQ